VQPQGNDPLGRNAFEAMVALVCLVQDYLQAGCLSKVVGGQIVREPQQLLRMSMFMRSPEAGLMFVSNFMGILMYDFLFKLAKLVSPAHEALLKPFPGLLFRWRCLVRVTNAPVKLLCLSDAFLKISWQF
jgi:hypothetical protein